MSDLIKFLKKRERERKEIDAGITLILSSDPRREFFLPNFNRFIIETEAESEVERERARGIMSTSSPLFKAGVELGEPRGEFERALEIGWYVKKELSTDKETGRAYYRYLPDYDKPFTLELDRGLRAWLLGQSGAGKTTLAKVIIEEIFEKDPERHIFVIDTTNEGEYLWMAREQTTPINKERLQRIGLEPRSYPVRVLIPPPLYQDEEFVKALEEKFEVLPVRVDPHYITIDVLKSLLFLERGGSAERLLIESLRDFRTKKGADLDELISIIAGKTRMYGTRVVERVLDKLRYLITMDVFGEFNFNKIFEERKINVFYVPEVLVPSVDERRNYISYFINILRTQVTGFPIFVVMEEALEIVRSVGAKLMTRTSIGALATRGRKQAIDQIYVSQTTDIIKEVLANTPQQFIFTLRPMKDTDLRKLGILNPREIEDVLNIPHYICLYRHGSKKELIAVRPTKSWLKRPV